MRWVWFFIFLLGAIVVQTTLAPFMAIQGVRPDFMILLMVHVALVAPAADAMLAGWAIGLGYDLSQLSYDTHANVGVAAFVFGLAAMLIVRIRSATYREHAATLFAFSLCAAMFIHTMLSLVTLYRFDQMSRWTGGLGVGLATAIYTAAVSPYAHWLLRRARGTLGFGPIHTLRVR